jgi:hypothetical protein
MLDAAYGCSLSLSVLERMVSEDRHINRTAEQVTAKPATVRGKITRALKRRLKGTETRTLNHSKRSMPECLRERSKKWLKFRYSRAFFTALRPSITLNHRT